ncbi:hypothetical protein OVS_02220 [Mycoplasma ovis str. Michigan]|uniref:Uncharacterized protein n=1 Tax=Mycoplasma ovis str. Michigan TaxID=1415773 RepID=A0ABN4BLK8_9MOLU|nr:hypothetical protein OVS_02220 [Mycoplasma ovis str. Michigan]
MDGNQERWFTPDFKYFVGPDSKDISKTFSADKCFVTSDLNDWKVDCFKKEK